MKALAILVLLAWPSHASLAAAQPPTAWAGGRVVDESGRPVAGARVELLSLSPKYKLEPVYQGLSAADGRFRIADLPADCWFEARVLQRGITVLVQRGIVSPVAGGQLALGTFRLPRLPALHGRVVDSRGKPLAGAEVWALSTADLDFGLELTRDKGPAARTDREGRFAIPRFAPGILEVCRPGLAPARVLPRLPGLNQIVLNPAPPPRRLTGRVIDGRRTPVPRAEVHLRARERDTWPPPTPESLWHPCSPVDPSVPVYDEASSPEESVARAGRDGSFAFELAGPPVPMEIWAKAAGYLGPDFSLQPVGAQLSQTVEIVLERGAVVTGRLLTARGLPAAGAEVLIEGRYRDSRELVRTDKSGRYRVVGLEPGPQTLHAEHASGKAERELTVPAGESRQPDLILDDDPLREIRGRVTGPDGAGLAEFDLRETYLSPSFQETSGADGSFRLELRESAAAGKTMVLEVGNKELIHRRVELDAAELAAALTTPLEIRLEAGTRVVGHVLGVAAESLPEATVELYQEGVQEGVQESVARRSPVSRDGKFRVGGLSPGGLLALVSFQDGCGAARITLEPGVEEVVLDLEIPQRFAARGTVLGPDGAPIFLAFVRFLSSQEVRSCADKATVTTYSGEDGTFSTLLQEGRYTVLVGAPGFVPILQEAPLTVEGGPVEGLVFHLGSRVATQPTPPP